MWQTNSRDRLFATHPSAESCEIAGQGCKLCPRRRQSIQTLYGNPILHTVMTGCPASHNWNDRWAASIYIPSPTLGTLGRQAVLVVTPSGPQVYALGPPGRTTWVRACGCVDTPLLVCTQCTRRHAPNTHAPLSVVGWGRLQREELQWNTWMAPDTEKKTK